MTSKVSPFPMNTTLEWLLAIFFCSPGTKTRTFGGAFWVVKNAIAVKVTAIRKATSKKKSRVLFGISSVVLAWT